MGFMATVKLRFECSCVPQHFVLGASSSLRWEWEFKKVEPSGRSLGYWGGYSQKGKSLSFYSEIQCFLYNPATAAHAEGETAQVGPA